MERSTHPASAKPSPSGVARPDRREHAGIEYWRVERVARYLDVSRKRVYQLVQEKKLAAIKFGPRMLRILRPSIDQYLAEAIEQGLAEQDDID